RGACGSRGAAGFRRRYRGARHRRGPPAARRFQTDARCRSARRSEDLGRKLGFGERIAAPCVTQDRMILLSPDAVEDIERLRSFLHQNNPDAARRALALIWAAIDRLQEFPDLGMATGDADIRQIVVRFGASGYIVRYAALPGPKDILITRIWHGRHART